jgi:hypothetical protein
VRKLSLALPVIARNREYPSFGTFFFTQISQVTMYLEKDVLLPHPRHHLLKRACRRIDARRRQIAAKLPEYSPLR